MVSFSAYVASPRSFHSPETEVTAETQIHEAIISLARPWMYIVRLDLACWNLLIPNASFTNWPYGKYRFYWNCRFPFAMFAIRDLDCGYRLDIVVADAVVVEVKAVESITPLHEAQLLTYLRLEGWKVGLLINFNVPHYVMGSCVESSRSTSPSVRPITRTHFWLRLRRAVLISVHSWPLGFSYVANPSRF